MRQRFQDLVGRARGPHHLRKVSTDDKARMHLLPFGIVGKACHRGMIHLRQMQLNLEHSVALSSIGPPTVVAVQRLELTEFDELADAGETGTLQKLPVVTEQEHSSKIGDLFERPLLPLGFMFRLGFTFLSRLLRLGVTLRLGFYFCFCSRMVAEERLWARHQCSSRLIRMPKVQTRERQDVVIKRVQVMFRPTEAPRIVEKVCNIFLEIVLSICESGWELRDPRVSIK